jgi:hypothetical protein
MRATVCGKNHEQNASPAYKEVHQSGRAKQTMDQRGINRSPTRTRENLLMLTTNSICSPKVPSKTNRFLRIGREKSTSAECAGCGRAGIPTDTPATRSPLAFAPPFWIVLCRNFFRVQNKTKLWRLKVWQTTFSVKVLGALLFCFCLDPVIPEKFLSP